MADLGCVCLIVEASSSSLWKLPPQVYAVSEMQRTPTNGVSSKFRATVSLGVESTERPLLVCANVALNSRSSDVSFQTAMFLSNTVQARRGETFGLLGVNGAGKSTTFEIMTGALRSAVHSRSYI
jgi:ABC-type glutathione transport system ATPase component